MRKSSQGGPGRRVSGMRADAEEQRGRRGSGIPQPGWGRRSSSETRDGRMSALPGPMRRSRSQVNIYVTPASSSMTPMHGIPSGAHGSAQSQRMTTSPFSDCGRSSRKSAYSGLGSVKPVRVIKDTRPLTDKASQQQEIQKITGFLHSQPDVLSFAPKGINLRQLTTKLFVELFNYLTGYLDVKVCVNMTNYINEIPIILKRWVYIGNLNTSWLKTVNTPHSFPHVLGVLAWLTTCATAVTTTNYEAVLQLSLSGEDDEAFPFGNAAIYIQHLFKQYPLWNSNNEAAEQEEERWFIEELCNRNGVGDEEMREVAESIRELEAQLNDPKEKAEAEAGKEDQKKYNEFMKDYTTCVDYKTRMEEFLDSGDVMLEEEKLKLRKDEENLDNLRNRIVELKDQLSNQAMTVEERDALLSSCNELSRAIRENEEYIAVVSGQSYADDIEMARKRTNIQSKTQEYNKVIIKESYWLPELEDLKNNTNFLHQGAGQELAEIDSRLLKLKSELVKKRQNCVCSINELKNQLHQTEERMSLLCQEMGQNEGMLKQNEEAIENVKARSAEELDALRKIIETLEAANKAHMSSNSLEAAKEQLQYLIEKREYGKSHIENLKKKAESFFQQSALITQGFVTNVKKAEAEFLNKRDNILKSVQESSIANKENVNKVEEKL